MLWSAVVVAVQIILLAVLYLLYQHARADLTARAAERPVLAELRGLQETVAEMVEELRRESIQASAQLECRCREARDLLQSLEKRLGETGAAVELPVASRRPAAVVQARPAPADAPTETRVGGPQAEPRYAVVCDLARSGAPAEEIARRAGLSVGEVELILSVRAPAA
ncbi:MAG TPA: hypothetical protein VLH79_05750 [Chthonomonadales bacterium]|nr:hypothetical protein [Chthonomonadales bacterium]